MTRADIQQTLDAERQLATSFENYAGEWVAIRGHEVVQHSETLNGLLERVDTAQVDRIQHVAAKRFGFCFF